MIKTREGDWMTDIIILGAGGFAKEVLFLIEDKNKVSARTEFNVKAFSEDNSKRVGELLNGVPIIDTKEIEDWDRDSIKLICAIGDPIRRSLIERFKNRGFEFCSVIHPSVISSQYVNVGEGSIICAGNILTTQVAIGKHVIVNLDCTIGHDVIIEDYCTISPGVHISGRVHIKQQTYIGTGSAIIERLNIGKNSVIGAGAVVTKDIPDNVVAVGMPAKVIKRRD
jgi:sugar O-acyltransferase (sialic acid O-acetyltransferase NeuD family)